MIRFLLYFGGSKLEDEIDLRPYLKVLFQRAKWIIATALLFAAITFFIIRSAPNTYKATALIFVAANSDIIQFDPRIQEVTNREPLLALPELAESDMVLSKLISEGMVQELNTIESLRKDLEAESGSDRSIVRLAASSQDPVQAAEIANLWAELFTTEVNSILGFQSDGQVTFFENQLVQAEEALEAAENNLITFQQVNRSNTISNTLQFYQQEQILYLTVQQDLTSLIWDAEQLRNQLGNQPVNTPASIADQLVSLTLQLEGINSQSPTPLLFQLDSDTSLIGENRSEQLEFLDRLIELLQSKLSRTENELLTLEPEILRLQQEWQQATVTYDRLENNRLIASETYLTLARKVEEERITKQDENRGLQIISRAVVPNDPESKNTILFSLAAGIVGGLISATVLLTITWWRQV